MDIAILSAQKDSYSTSRLQAAAVKRGHTVRIINYLRCYLDITTEKHSIYCKGEELPAFDAVIPRISSKRTFYGTAVVRQFEMKHTFCLNSSLAITRSRDKLRSQQILARKHIPMPTTGFANSADDIDHLIKIVGGPPLIIKLIEGTQGVGVVLAETKKAAESSIQAFMSLNANIIVQEYIKEAAGADIRCFVIGNKVVAAMKRQAQAGEFRSNIHRGGSAVEIKLSKEEEKIAVKAAKGMGLQVAGVDLLRSGRGPLIMEVNSSPGLEGIETATGKDIAGMIIEYIEKNAKPLTPDAAYHG